MKKMYYYTFLQTLFFGIVVFGMDFVLVALLVTNVLPIWVTFLPAVLLTIATWNLFRIGFFSPIYLSETKIKFKGQEYFWDDIKIIAYPKGLRYPCNAYVLYFESKFCHSKEMMEKNAICQVYLNQKNLDMILTHYKKKFFIVDPMDFVPSFTISASKKIKIKIETHNKKIVDEYS